MIHAVPTGPADTDLLVICASRFARALGVAPGPESRVREVIERVLVQRQAIEAANAGILTRDEAINLLLSHWDSSVFGLPEGPNRATAGEDPALRRDMERGVFGERS